MNALQTASPPPAPTPAAERAVRQDQVVAALGPLLPAAARDAITADSDRITIPAPDGPGTLSAALWRLNSY